MSTPIPEFLWLRDYEERLEFRTNRHRDGMPTAPQPMFMSIR